MKRYIKIKFNTLKQDLPQNYEDILIQKRELQYNLPYTKRKHVIISRDKEKQIGKNLNLIYDF